MEELVGATPSTETYSTKYEELTIQNHFNPEDYAMHLVTDNPGARIFMFNDDEKPVYKTVLIKPESRLKVIDLTNDALLMNEII